MAVTRTQTTEVPLRVAETYQKCLRAAEAIPRASLIAADEDSGTITLKVPMSLKSWGERVVLSLREAGTARTQVEVTSKASFPLTFADYGTNAQNVQQVVDWLAEHASAEAAP